METLNMLQTYHFGSNSMTTLPPNSGVVSETDHLEGVKLIQTRTENCDKFIDVKVEPTENEDDLVDRTVIDMKEQVSPSLCIKQETTKVSVKDELKILNTTSEDTIDIAEQFIDNNGRIWDRRDARFTTVIQNSEKLDNILVEPELPVVLSCGPRRVVHKPVKENITTPFISWKGTGSISKNVVEEDDTHYVNRKRRFKLRIFCLYCKNYVLHFARHLFRKHHGEAEVKEIMNLSPKSKLRVNLLTDLKRKGYFVDSFNICKPLNGTNSLVCSKCLGSFSTKELLRHREICIGQNDKKSAVSDQNIRIKNLQIDQELRFRIFTRMRPDEISLMAQSDELICAYGANHLKGHQGKNPVLVTSRKMRELARLLIELKKMQPSIEGMLSSLKPEYFPHFVSASRIICKYDEENDDYGTKATAVSIGPSLRMCCRIGLSLTQTKGYFPNEIASNLKSDLTGFMKLMGREWHSKILNPILDKRKRRKLNNTTTDPKIKSIVSMNDNSTKKLEHTLNINNKLSSLNFSNNDSTDDTTLLNGAASEKDGFSENNSSIEMETADVTKSAEEFSVSQGNYLEVVLDEGIGMIDPEVPQNEERKPKRFRPTIYCLFCKLHVSNFVRHLKRKHGNEIEIKEILKLSSSNKKRRISLNNLRRRGNAMDNRNIRKSVSCPKCFGVFKQLKRHRTHCTGLIKSKYRPSFNEVIFHDFNDEQLRLKIFPKMRLDEVSMVAQSDKLICLYGAHYLESHQGKYVLAITSRKIRELARLVMELKKIKSSIEDLSSALKPDNFSLIISAIRRMAKYDEENDSFESATTALNLRSSIKECCVLIVDRMMKEEHNYSKSSAIADMNALIELISSKWHSEISIQPSNYLKVKEKKISKEIENSASSDISTSAQLPQNSKKDILSAEIIKYCVEKKPKRILTPWTIEQKEVVKNFFAEHIENAVPPKRLECAALKEQYEELLHNKDWLKIKVFIQNEYVKYHKRAT